MLRILAVLSALALCQPAMGYDRPQFDDPPQRSTPRDAVPDRSSPDRSAPDRSTTDRSTPTRSTTDWSTRDSFNRDSFTRDGRFPDRTATDPNGIDQTTTDRASATDRAPRSTGRKTVICGMTINSSDEIREFVRKLRPGQSDSEFEYVELTKMGNDQTWFKNACRSKVQCDILVLSSHFGGTFFGDHNKIRLSMSTLEEASCNNSCDGILKNPREVFFFTCNVLAGKAGDARTPRQYYQVLLEYYPPHIAQYYVQTRYGAWGGTFLGRTTRTFYRVPRLYGYNSVSPYGKDAKAWVNRYLNAIADYGRHLASVKPNTVNQTLIRTIGSTGMIQKSGVQPGTLGDTVRTNLCNYFNAGSTEGKLAVLARNLRLQNFEPYLTYVEEFYREHKPGFGAAHRDIQQNTRVKSHVLKMIEVSVDMPHTRIDLVNFASNVGWIDRGQRNAYVEKIVRDLFAGQMTADRVFDVCSVGQRHRDFIGKYVNLPFIESIRPASQWDYRYVEMVGCLRPETTDLQDTVARFMDKDKYAWKYRWAAAYTFLDTKPQTAYVRLMLALAADDPHRAVRQTARQAAKNWKISAPAPDSYRRRSTPTTQPLSSTAPRTPGAPSRTPPPPGTDAPQTGAPDSAVATPEATPARVPTYDLRFGGP